MRHRSINFVTMKTAKMLEIGTFFVVIYNYSGCTYIGQFYSKISSPGNIIHVVNLPTDNKSMRDFVPASYRSFLKRLPPPKRQQQNQYLDENFEVTIGSSANKEKPLVVSIKPSPKTPNFSQRPRLSQTRLRRSTLLSASTSSNTETVKSSTLDSCDRPPTVSVPLKKYTKSESAIVPKQFILPSISDKKIVRPATMRSSNRPKWVTKVEIRKRGSS